MSNERKIRIMPFEWKDPKDIPPRRFVYGKHYMRRIVSQTIGNPGAGKSSLSIVEALSIATGRPLLGIEPDEQTRVWLYNGGEDDDDELQRRVVATATHYEIDPSELLGQLFVTSGVDLGGKIAEATRGGVSIVADIVASFVEIVREQGIGVVILDPLVSFHDADENKSGHMDMVAAAFLTVAREGDCAVELVHHPRKPNGAAEINVEDARGSGAVVGKARNVRILNTLPDDQAKKAGVKNGEYFWSKIGKTNVQSRSGSARWYRNIGVKLANGDDVSVVASATRPTALDALSDEEDIAKAKDAIATGEWRSNSQAKGGKWASNPIAAALGIDLNEPDQKPRVTGIINGLVSAGHFVKVKRKGPGKNGADVEFLEPHHLPRKRRRPY